MDDDKFSIISKNLQELTNEDIIKQCLNANKNISLYWGTAPTGRPHIAYFLAMTKLADYLNADCHVTILLADLHAYLDNMKAPWEQLEKRTEYYEILIKGMLKALNVKLDKLCFVKGTDFQLNENYTKNVYEIISLTSIRDATKAGCEVVKQVSDPLLCSIVYPLLQALDEEYLNVDVQFGGVDQRKIFMYAEKYMNQLGFSKRAHLMNPMIEGLTGDKMSASDVNSKIDLLDNPVDIKNKLKNAQQPGLFSFLKNVLLTNKQLIQDKKLDEIESFEKVNEDFQNGKINLDYIKSVIESSLVTLLKDIANEFVLCGKEDLITSAYSQIPNVNNVELDPNFSYKNLSDFPTAFTALIDEFSKEYVPYDVKKYPLILDQKPTILWSCKSSGEPHLGYLYVIEKLAVLSQHGWNIKILIEDIGALMLSKHLKNRPDNWLVMKARANLYRELFISAFIDYGGDANNFSVICGSDYQLKKDFGLLFYQCLSKLSHGTIENLLNKIFVENDSITSNLSTFIYPCLFALDSIYHSPTVRLVGKTDYWKNMFDFSEHVAELMNYKNKDPLFIPHEMMSSLNGNDVMSSPKIAAKTAPKDVSSISLIDSPEVIQRKLKKAFFDPKNVENDPSLDIISKVLWRGLVDNNILFRVERTVENGGDLDFNSMQNIRDQLTNDLLHPGDIKLALGKYLSVNLNRITRSISNLNEMFNEAFPEEGKKVKIGKKDFNPNTLDLRVTNVEKVEFRKGQLKLYLKAGLNSVELDLVDKSCRGLTPGDKLLVLWTPEHQCIGLLGDNTSGSIVKLQQNQYYAVNVVFKQFDVPCPHLKMDNPEEIRQLFVDKGAVNDNLFVHNNKLMWKKSNGYANDLEFHLDSSKVQPIKITLLEQFWL